MTEPDDVRCPGCGAAASSRYCPHCGARTGWADLAPPGTSELPGAAAAPVAAPAADVRSPASPAGWDADAPTVPGLRAVARPVPARAMPEMFATEFVPVAAPGQAWSQAVEPGGVPPNPAPGLFPGWTGMHPVVPIGAAAGMLAPRPERRRKAIYAVLGIAAATVLVLLAALLIAPKWRGTGGTGGTVADKIGQGVVVSSPAVSTAPTATTPGASTPRTTPSTAVEVPPARTVTVTASTGTTSAGTGATRTAATGTATRTGATGTAATGTARTGAGGTGTSATASARSTATPTTAKPTPAKPTPKPTPVKPTTAKPTPAPVLPLGVPQRDITCTGGYIVQLASELDQPRFTARVAALKSAGQVPAGALAADSTRSCGIFTSQVNTLVLYSGPYQSKYDGCAARLAGPADAYIKGGNAGTAREYISCLCPASAAALPRYSAVGQQGVWVGELQRVLGNRLNIGVGDLTGNWGRFTAGTQAAVRRFQQVANLPSNGVVDARTWSALQSAEC